MYRKLSETILICKTKNISSLRTSSAADGSRSVPMLQHCVSSSCTQRKWGRQTHGWSAPHGPTLCGLRPTSDSSGSQPGCAPLTFSVPFHCNNLELQGETGTTYGEISSSGLTLTFLYQRVS